MAGVRDLRGGGSAAPHSCANGVAAATITGTTCNERRQKTRKILGIISYPRPGSIAHRPLRPRRLSALSCRRGQHDCLTSPIGYWPPNQAKRLSIRQHDGDDASYGLSRLLTGSIETVR